MSASQFLTNSGLSATKRMQLLLHYFQAKARLRKYEVGIEPISELNFPMPLGAQDTYAIEKLGLRQFIDDNWQRLLDSPIRLVFVVHDTAGTYNSETGLDLYEVAAWSGDNTGTGAEDDHFHSHNVASCIAGKTRGVQTGLLWKLFGAGKAVLVADKVLSRGGGTFSWISTGINRTAELRYRENDLVIHVNSYGATGLRSHPQTDRAIRKCIDLGQLFLASSGNSGNDPTGNSRVGYPAVLEKVIAVGAVGPTDLRKSYSSTGPEVYGTCYSGVPCINPDGSIAQREGTSFSQPYLSAMVGLYALFLGRKINQDEAMELIRTRSIDLGQQGRDTFYGFGLTHSQFYEEGNDDPGEQPGDEPPQDPPPAPKTAWAERWSQGPYILRYMTVSEREKGSQWWKVLIIDSLYCHTQGETKDRAQVHLSDMLEEYFVNHGHAMVIPDDEGATEALQYVGRFFFFFSRSKEQPVHTSILTGHNERNLPLRAIRNDERFGGLPGSTIPDADTRDQQPYLVDLGTDERIEYV